jgi:hypothetical protein
MIEFGVVLFHTTSAALRAEKTIVRAGLVVKMIPTPREFSSDCGIALRFEWEAVEQVKSLLTSAQVEVAAIYPWP